MIGGTQFTAVAIKAPGKTQLLDRIVRVLSYDLVVAGSDHSTPYRSGRKPKRMRTAFSAQQLLQLDDAFKANQYLVGQQRRQLASGLNLTETQVNNTTFLVNSFSTWRLHVA